MNTDPKKGRDIPPESTMMPTTINSNVGTINSTAGTINSTVGNYTSFGGVFEPSESNEDPDCITFETFEI